MFQLNMIKRVLSMNKMAFDSVYNTTTMIQDQAEQMASFYLQQYSKIPENNKKIFSDWMGVLKKGREEYKKVVDQFFDSILK